ncbi:MAG: response regulator transcription factor [Candidatus Omnitrophica bacterium]|nr:response regulator transcription factor [Candidatus Omnitrophota bacterium]
MMPTEQTQAAYKLRRINTNKEVMPRIMVVDDDVELLEELKELLSASNYEVEVMPNSALAFEVACELKPDLVLLDLKMKPKSGFQLADELHNSFKTKAIPIIAITGFFTEKEHVLMMKMCGIKHALLKPFNPPDLIAKIESVLEESKSSPEPPPA